MHCIDISITYEDCDGAQVTESSEQYEFCCTTDDCNYVDIDVANANCVSNTNYDNVLDELYMCISGLDSANNAWGCNDQGVVVGTNGINSEDDYFTVRLYTLNHVIK